MEDIELPDAGLDEPSAADFKHEEVFSEFWGALSDWVQNRRTSLYNQNAQKETYYSCSVYGAIHAINESNAIEAEGMEIKVDEKDALKIARDVINAKIGFRQGFGWVMQGMLKYAKDNGWIDGYTLVRKVWNDNGDAMRRALENGYILYTGSNNIKWKETGWDPNAICVPWKSYGHIFCIDGYNGDRFHIRQSVGTQWFDKGYAYLPEWQLASLFSVYALIDHSDFDVLTHFKAVKAGIYNGENPNTLATRLETVTMLSRWSGKTISDIYNGDRPNDVPSELEMRIMTERAFDIPNSDIKTRKQIAIYCVINQK